MVIEALMPKAAIATRWHGDVLAVELHGWYSRSAHRQMRLVVKEELLYRPARAIVADLRQAVSSKAGMSDAERVGIVEEAASQSWPVTAPVAVVAPQAVMHGVRAMCAAAWAQGWYWVPFSSEEYDDALDWASRRRLHPARQSRPAPFA